jgi:hypothetical protein
MLDIILLAVGAILFALDAANVKVGTVKLVSLGLLAWILVPLLGALKVG